MKIFLGLLLVFLPAFCLAEPLDFGVCVHLEKKSSASIRHEMDLIAGAGIRWVRYDFRWNTIEHDQGVWNFAPYDVVVSEAARRKINILAILDYGTDWASTAPFYASKRVRWLPYEKPWRNFVLAVVARYKGKIHAWEVWNEPNTSVRWQPRPNPAEYVSLLKEASQSIKAVDPDAKVVFGGSSGVDLPYLKECYKQGAARYIDAVAFHPYAYPRQPEDLLSASINAVFSLTREYAEKPVEVWITEIGWPTETDQYGVTEEKQANYLARTFFLALISPVRHVFWYDFIDDGQHPDNPEDHFGLVTHGTRRLKPAYQMARNLLFYFSSPVEAVNTQIAFRYDIGTTVYASQFYDHAGHILLIPFWSKEPSGKILFQIPGNLASSRIEVIDLLTDQKRVVRARRYNSTFQYQRGNFTFKATQSPQILKIDPAYL